MAPEYRDLSYCYIRILNQQCNLFEQAMNKFSDAKGKVLERKGYQQNCARQAVIACDCFLENNYQYKIGKVGDIKKHLQAIIPVESLVFRARSSTVSSSGPTASYVYGVRK